MISASRGEPSRSSIAWAQELAPLERFAEEGFGADVIRRFEAFKRTYTEILRLAQSERHLLHMIAPRARETVIEVGVGAESIAS
eukprot:4642966-Pleurochrysis_carterae.AAC.2